ncbi:MAG: M20/M25/M40 family metallo-hydrolase [Candidatus Aquicultor sp.]|nr:M20/M25/M40 family metallo-hydrolase [Candidatus Aquicultor sp.]
MVDEGRVLRIFENLASIYSPSYNERAIADHITSYLSALSYLTFEDETGSSIKGNTGNIHVTIPGTADGPCILFAAHIDTVEPAQGVKVFVEDGLIKSKGDTILGADDKAGVTAMLELATVLAATTFAHGPVHLVFTVAEEVGLKGAKYLDLDDKNLDYAYVLDANGKVGLINVKAPYQDSFEVEFIGKAAHAGIAPETGINAIVAASKAISMMKLGRIDSETTANVGTIEGGIAGNIVAERAKVFAESRSISIEKLQQQSRHMVECFNAAAEETGASVNIVQYRPYEGYSLTEDEPIVARAISAMKSIGIEPVITHTGGGSDTNVFNAKGVVAVNLSMGAENVHGKDEFLPVAELVKLSELLLALIRSP